MNLPLIRYIGSLTITVRGPDTGDSYTDLDPIWLAEGDAIVIEHAKGELVVTVRKPVPDEVKP